MANNKILGAPTTNTISGLLQRINSSANVIWNKAADLSLSIPSGAYWDLKTLLDQEIYTGNLVTGSNSPAADYTTDAQGTIVNYNFGIDAVASAIDAITLLNRGNLTLDANGSYQVPVGYVSVPYTITANALSDQINVNATDKYLYKDITAYGILPNGEKGVITGTLDNVYLYYKNDTDKSYSANKIGTGTYLKVSINAPTGSGASAVYSTTDTLQTNIPYRATLTTNYITGSTSAKGTAGTAANIAIGNYLVYSGGAAGAYKLENYLKLTPTEGYYDGVWYTDIKVDPTVPTDLEITKSTDADGTETTTVGTIQVPAGYYTTPITISPVIHWDNTTPDRVLNYFTGTLTPTLAKTGKLEDYLGANKSYDYIDPTALFVVTTGSVSISKTINADGSITFSKDVTSGWVDADDVTMDNLTVAGSTHTLTTHTDNKFGGSSAVTTGVVEIKNPFFKDVLTAGYTPGETKYYVIQLGGHNLTWNSNKTPEEEPVVEVTLQYLTDTKVRGWIEGGINYYKIKDVVINTTAGTNYKKITTAGWINPADADSKPYFVTSTVYSGNKTNTVGIGNGQQQFTIAGGTYLPEDVTFTFNSGTGLEGKINYATVKDIAWNIASADYEFTLSLSAGNTYWSEMKIDLTDLLAELQKI